MQTVSNLPISARLGFEPRWAAARSCCSESACMLRIPLVTEFGTDHIEKAAFMIFIRTKMFQTGGPQIRRLIFNLTLLRYSDRDVI